MEHIPAIDQVFTVRAFAGDLPVECFLSARGFLEEVTQARPSFSEDHVHASFELLLCRKGSGHQFIEGVAHAYEDESVFLLAPFVTHAHIANPGSAEVRCSIRFILPEAAAFSGRCEPALAAALERLRKEQYAQFCANSQIVSLANLLSDAVCSSESSALLVLAGLLSALFSSVFAELTRLYGAKDTGVPKLRAESDPARRLIIDGFFGQALDGSARIEDLCEQVHISPSSLNRVIRELYGTSFKQKLIEARVAYIKYYLKYTDLPVRAVAEKTGFLEDNKLSLFFKQHAGLSPTQYRQRERTSPPEPAQAGQPT